MKKNRLKKMLIIMFFIILGISTYMLCEQDYSINLQNYERNLEYLNLHPELGNYNEILIPNKKPAAEMYGKIIRNTYLFQLQWILPIIIICLSTFEFNKIVQSGFLKNISFRQLYSKYMKNSIIKMWLKSILIFVIPNIFIFLVCTVYSGFKIFDVAPMYVGNIFHNNIWLFLSTFIYFILYSIFCCNLGLLFIKKNRKYIVSIILAEIFYILLDVFIELGIGTVIDNLSLFNENLLFYTSSFNFVTVFTIFPYYYLGVEYAVWVPILIMLLLTLCTTAIVYLIYSNKEDIIDEQEV